MNIMGAMDALWDRAMALGSAPLNWTIHQIHWLEFSAMACRANDAGLSTYRGIPVLFSDKTDVVTLVDGGGNTIEQSF